MSSDQPLCGTCRWYAEMADYRMGPAGQCRLDPPQVVPLPTRSDTARLGSRWPIVFGDEQWCGQHAEVEQ